MQLSLSASSPSLEQAHRMQQVVARVSSCPFVRQGEVEALCRFITEQLAQLLGVERVSTWFFNEAQDELHLQDLYRLSLDRHESGAVLQRSAFESEFAFLLNSKFVDAHDPYSDPRTAGFIEPYLKPHGITSMLDSVIRHGERLVGMICLEHVGRPHRWADSEILLASQLCDQLSLAVAMRQVRQRDAELSRLNAELEARVHARSEELQAARQALAASEQAAALARMLAQVTHELNTPIGNALLAANTLRDGAVQLRGRLERGELGRRALEGFMQDQQKACSLIERSLQLANDRILALRGLAADQASDARRCFRLEGCVRELLDLLQPALQRGTCAIACAVDIDPQLELDSHPGALGQVLINLIGNAQMHAFEGRTQGIVRLSARPLDAQRLGLTVADDGAGIPSADVDRVFEPWFTSKRGQGGTGQGLVIVRQLVEQRLGGHIRLESALGAGCRFHLELPFTAP